MGQSDNVKMNIRRRYGIRKDHCYYVTTSMLNILIDSKDLIFIDLIFLDSIK